MPPNKSEMIAELFEDGYRRYSKTTQDSRHGESFEYF